MTDQQDYTLGEVGRMVEKLAAEVTAQRIEAQESRHRLADQINVLVGPVDVHRLQIAALERAAERYELELKEMRARVEGVALKAAAMSGGIGVLGVIGQWFWPWKGH